MNSIASLKVLLMLHPKKGYDMWLQQYEMRKMRFRLLVQEIEDSGRKPRKVITGPGEEEWRVDDPRDPSAWMYHRLDGPASTDESGKNWMVANQLHRIDGPAVEYEGANEWYLYGVPVESYEEYKLLTKCSDEDILLLKLMRGDMSEF